ncbi:MAG: hypothetical protein PVJ32_09585 [Anaerolineales bacterium]
MSKALRTCGSMMAGFFAFLFVVVTLIVLLVFNLEWRLFNPATLSGALEAQNLYERLPSIASDQLISRMTYDPCEEDPSLCEGEGQEPPGEEEGEGGPPDFLKRLSKEDWELLLSTLLPEGWLETQVNGALGGLFAFLNSETDTLSMNISFTELKTVLAGQAGIDAMLGLMRTLPPCDPELLASEEAYMESLEGGEGLLTCNPPEEMYDMILPELENALTEAAAQIPDEVDLSQSLLGFMGGGEEGEAADEAALTMGGRVGIIGCLNVAIGAVSGQGAEVNPLQWFQCGRLMLRLTPLLSVVLLLLIALFGVRSLRGWLRWWGVPLLITGILGIAMWLTSGLLANWALVNFIFIDSPMVTQDLMQITAGILRHILGSVFWYIGIESAMMVLLGCLMIGASVFVKSRPRVQQEESLELPSQPPELT